MAESEDLPTLNFPEQVTMKIGQTKTLKVDVVPANTPYLIDVDWCSIDERGGGSVDIVDAGSGSRWNETIWVEIEAYDAGTCIIEPDVCIYDSDGEVVSQYQAQIEVIIVKNIGYRSAKAAYKELNKFRTTKKVWQWKSNNKSKKYFNTNSKNKLKKLKRRADLEKTAKKRAKEIVKCFDHTRPNGKSCYSIYPKRYKVMGENIACGDRLTAQKVTETWKEDNYKYSGQGHRRNMLYKNFSYVGIACYEVDGYRYWVQCFGK